MCTYITPLGRSVRTWDMEYVLYLWLCRCFQHRIDFINMFMFWFFFFLGTCNLVLGKRLGFLQENNIDPMGEILADAIRGQFCASRDTFYGLPLWKVFTTPAYKRFIHCEDTIYEYEMLIFWKKKKNFLNLNVRNWALNESIFWGGGRGRYEIEHYSDINWPEN